MKGSVTSNYKISTIYGAVYKNNEEVLAVTNIVNAKSFNLDKMKLLFEKLPIGTYTLCIAARDEKGKKNLLKQEQLIIKAPSTHINAAEAFVNHKPVGCFELVESPADGQVHVKGWAADRDSLSSALKIHVWIGGDWNSGVSGEVITANTLRSDVDTVYPGFGTKHGFDATLKTNKTGKQTIYMREG